METNGKIKTEKIEVEDSVQEDDINDDLSTIFKASNDFPKGPMENGDDVKKKPSKKSLGTPTQKKSDNNGE